MTNKIPKEITITPLRELSYEDAVIEISEYIKRTKNKKLSISEIAEELSLDIELIEKILINEI